MPEGAFLAVVGPSGAGKDTILDLARLRLSADQGVVFARRTVTRPPHAGAEDHDSLDEAAFAAAQAAGAFCLSWSAHGLRYGLPAALASECARGRLVIANLSRRALTEAARRFAALHVVEVTARPDLLVRRIAARGRENAAEAEARLARAVPLVLPPGAAALHRIDNSGAPDAAADAFLALVSRLRAAPSQGGNAAS